MLLAILTTVAALGIVPLVMWIIGTVGGWGRLARAFPGDYIPVGETYRARTLEILPITNYSGCLNVIVAPEGLWMVPMLFFRFGHQPVLIPWRYVQRAESKSGVLPKMIVHFDVDGIRGRLHLPADALGRVEKLMPRQPTPRLPSAETTR